MDVGEGTLHQRVQAAHTNMVEITPHMFQGYTEIWKTYIAPQVSLLKLF